MAEHQFTLNRNDPGGSSAATRPEAEPEPKDALDEARAAAESSDQSLQTIMRETKIQPVLEQLDRELVALAPVKQRIREIAALLVIERLRHEAGLSSDRPSLHMSFTGNPGTGKTTVALRIADILHRLGYIEKNQLITVTRDDLVGQYVGHTAPKTKEILDHALGGVLFIDEAYYLHRPNNERDYGQETIEVLLQYMESERERLVVVFAGYKDPMDEFFRANPGMGSRVAHHIEFPDYTLDELMQIARLMLEHQNYELDDDAGDALRQYVERRMRQPRFAQGRSIRNAIDRARMRQANRLFESDEELGRRALVLIEADDIYKSSVFERDVPEDESEVEDDGPTRLPPS